MHDIITRLREPMRFASRRLGRIAAAIALFGALISAPLTAPAGSPYTSNLYRAAAPKVVTSDRGGYLAARSDEIDAMRATGQRVELRGTCLSACTMYLSLPNVCVTPSAVLGFHGPSDNGAPLPARDFEYWSQVMAANYDEPLRSWFMREGRYIHAGYYKLTGAQLIRMGYPQC